MKLFLGTLLLAFIGVGSATFYFPRFCRRPHISNAHTLRKKIYTSGQKEYVKCHTGYKLEGSYKIYCRNGRWSTLPRCVKPKVYCKFPGKPASGYISHTKTSYPVGFEVTWGCNDGYVRYGSSSAKCQSNGVFSAKAPICKQITCSRPDVPKYAGINPDRKTYTYKTKVTYHCDKGSVRSGGSTRYCQKNGQWSGKAPSCKRVKCEAYSVNSISAILPKADFYAVGEKIVFLCKKGYYLEGKPADYCLKGAKWKYGASAKRICKKGSKPVDVYCRVPPVKPEVVVTPHKKLYKPGDIVTLSCKQFYKYSGDKTAICGWDQQFHLTATPTCTKIPPPTWYS